MMEVNKIVRYSFFIFSICFLIMQLFINIIDVFNINKIFFEQSTEKFLIEKLMMTLIFIIITAEIVIFSYENCNKKTVFLMIGLSVFNIVLFNQIYTITGLQKFVFSINQLTTASVFTMILFAFAIIGISFCWKHKFYHTIKGSMIDVGVKKTEKLSTSEKVNESKPVKQEAKTAIVTSSETKASTVNKKADVKSDDSTKMSMPLFILLCLLVYSLIIAFVFIKPTLTEDFLEFIKDTNLTLNLFSAATITIFIVCFVPMVISIIYQSFIKAKENMNKNVTVVEGGKNLLLSFFVMAVMLYGGKFLGNSLDTLLSEIVENAFLAIPIRLSIYFFMAFIFVEMVFEILKPESEAIKNLKECVKESANSLTEIIKSLASDFFLLLKTIPDFLKAILSIMFEMSPSKEKSD